MLSYVDYVMNCLGLVYNVKEYIILKHLKSGPQSCHDESSGVGNLNCVMLIMFVSLQL